MKITVRRTRTLAYLLLVCITLAALLLVGCGEKTPAERNAVTSVTVAESEITVKAVLTESYLESCGEVTLHLFELPAHLTAPGNLSKLTSLGEASPKGEVSFTLSAFDNMRSRLYSSFVLAAKDTAGNYTVLTAPMAVENPEAVAEGAPTVSEKTSIKGLICDRPTDALRLGISHTVVDVVINDLVRAGWQEEAVSYLCNGVTAYLDGDALSALDETIGLYTAAGVEVYLRFVLTEPDDDDDLPADLYVPGALDKATAGTLGYAVNMSSEATATLMQGFFTFMADRYATPEGDSRPVTAFIPGYRVNNATAYAAAGNMSLDEQMTNYEQLVRVANTALLAHRADGRVYISLDHRRVSGGDTAGWDVPTFLAAFREEAALRGDFDWQVAAELYAPNATVWVADAAVDAAHFTVRNLATLTDLLTGETYRTRTDEERRLLITGMSVPGAAPGETVTDEQAGKQAASYAYTYMTALHNGKVEALIYDCYADRPGESPAGLWQTDATESIPVARRQLYTVFAKVDTSAAGSLSQGFTALIGAPYTKLETALAGDAFPITSLNGTGSTQSFTPSHDEATPLFTFDGGSLHGFANAGNLTFIELRPAAALERNALYARFDRTDPTAPMAISTTVDATDLRGRSTLLLDLYSGVIGDTAVTDSLTLRISRSSKGAASSGDGELIYESTATAISATSWQTASFDVSSLTTLIDKDDTLTLTLILDGPSGSAHHLGLAGIYATGNARSAGGTPATWVIVLIVVVVILAAAGGVAFLALRARQPKRYHR